MSLTELRKRTLTVETTHHEGGPAPAEPLRIAVASAVVRNPYAGRYEPDLLPWMAELRILGKALADDLVQTLGRDSVEVGIQDAPRPKEILYALAMGTGGRVHSRLGGLTKDKVSVNDGQR